MAELVYSVMTSLDGYVADTEGNFDWSAPDEEVHAFVNDLERPIGTYLYGRRLYEVMQVWETMPTDDPDEESAAVRDYAGIWRAAEKVVFSSTLPAVSIARTRLERHFQPDTVRQWKAESESDLSIGGPTLAAEALRAGLVDRVHLFLNPVIVGGGTPALPDDLRLDLDLVDERGFTNGVVHVHYDVKA